MIAKKGRHACTRKIICTCHAILYLGGAIRVVYVLCRECRNTMEYVYSLLYRLKLLFFPIQNYIFPLQIYIFIINNYLAFLTENLKYMALKFGTH